MAKPTRFCHLSGKTHTLNKTNWVSQKRLVNSHSLNQWSPLQRDDTTNPYFLYFAPDSTHAPAYSSADWAGSSVRATHYGAAVRELDWAVGRVLSAAAGNSRNTLVIFTSDNGAALVSREQAGSNGPLLCGKQTTFEVVLVGCSFFT